MATGEGKTYAIALAAATAGLCGVPVHIITANEYLAARDAEKLTALYSALSISVGAVQETQDSDMRKMAYAMDITYCTAKALAFDYLKDKAQKKKNNNQWQHDEADKLFLRGLCMAIIDEADSILIDEASVPLILSTEINNQQQLNFYSQSLSIARNFIKQQDYVLNQEAMQVTLTLKGKSKLDAIAITLPAVWLNTMHREESICMAIAAQNLYELDYHYVVQDGKISMIDTITGRIAIGRKWSQGLQQLIELKEACEPSNALSTISQITFQRFFPKYVHLCGISGTLNESRKELIQAYNLTVNKVPLNQPSKRKTLPVQLFKTTESRNQALLNRAKKIHDTGRPILIATESVAESEELFQVFKLSGLNPIVLNAKYDAEEAALIAQAGKKGAITITTNMAGRGTDIHISQSVNQLGGLHLISCQVNSARRIDRQLIGRVARQSTQGSAEKWIALDNTLIQKWMPKWLLAIVKQYCQTMPAAISQSMLHHIQRKEERYSILLRKQLQKSDKHLEKSLMFGDTYE